MDVTMAWREAAEMIQRRTIRELIESFPGVMPVLASYGLDLCCGGGHTVEEAARLHHLDVSEVVQQVTAVIAEQAEQRS